MSYDALSDALDGSDPFVLIGVMQANSPSIASNVLLQDLNALKTTTEKPRVPREFEAVRMKENEQHSVLQSTLCA